MKRRDAFGKETETMATAASTTKPRPAKLKLATVTPSVNTAVEQEFNEIRLSGVVHLIGRIYTDNTRLATNEDVDDFLRQINENISIAIRDVMTAKPDHLVMGISAPAFAGGPEGEKKLQEKLQELAGVPVTTPPRACVEALQKFGAKRISIITPYQSKPDESVRNYFMKAGFDVAAIKGLRIADANEIANIPEPAIVQAIKEVDGPDVDAILQVGANLGIARLADAAERWLGKPVMGVNMANLWSALRTNGITDPVDGVGRLFREF
jgi:maleate isomerase